MKIRRLQEFTNIVEEYRNLGYIFRGVDDSSYKPTPSLVFNEKDDCYSCFENEFKVYEELFAKCDNMGIDKISLLQISRHYGLHCRFVDYSSNPYVSLYFACKKEEVDGKVICFDLPKYSKKHAPKTDQGRYLDNKEIMQALLDYDNYGTVGQTITYNDGEKESQRFDYPIPIRPRVLDTKMVAQGGMFLMWFDLGIHEDKVVDLLNKFSHEIIVDKTSKKKILLELKKLNYCKETIEDLTSDFLSKYGEHNFKNLINELNEKIYEHE